MNQFSGVDPHEARYRVTSLFISVLERLKNNATLFNASLGAARPHFFANDIFMPTIWRKKPMGSNVAIRR